MNILNHGMKYKALHCSAKRITKQRNSIKFENFQIEKLTKLFEFQTLG